MSTSQVLQRLYSIDTSSPDFLQHVQSLLQNDDKERYLSGLQGPELIRLVDLLDRVLDVVPSADDVYRRCLHKLRAICGHHAILPSSHAISGGVFRIGDEPAAFGGFSDVWKGTCNGNEVCIKYLRVSEQNRQAILKAFYKEAVIWKRLRHPNVVPFIGVTTRPFQFVSEWMPNGTLPEYVNANPDADRNNLLLDVAEGLAYLHANHMTHGDLKGPNILIDPNGHARLTDFGFASVVRGLNSSLMTQVNGYTARWTAPEVLENDDKKTRESDMFAFAMVVVEVFTRRCPFSELSAPAAIAKIMDGIRPGRPHEPGLSDSVWDITVRCWHQDPTQRPTTTRVVGALRECSGLRDTNLHLPILVGEGTGGTEDLAPVQGTQHGGLGASPGGLDRSETQYVIGDLNHDVRCDSCSQVIIGTRYQCGCCPSLPLPYSLCQSCDNKSYMIHDPTHIFFKLRQPVDRPVECTEPILPLLYRHRVASRGFYDPLDPKAYLQNVMHGSILCDLCMEPIRGQWFHCMYCPRDLCEHCEEVDEHDTTHFSMVAKAPVDMAKFSRFTRISSEEDSQPPIMKYPVYHT